MRKLQGAFGGWDRSSRTGVGFHRHAQCAAKCLEYGFRLMMRIAAGQVVDVQGHHGMIDKTLEKFIDQIDVEFADAGAYEFDVKFHAGASREVHHHARQCFIQRHISMTVTAQALLVPDRLRECLSKGDADILNRMVGIDMQIPLGAISKSIMP